MLNFNRTTIDLLQCILTVIIGEIEQHSVIHCVSTVEDNIILSFHSKFSKSQLQ